MRDCTDEPARARVLVVDDEDLFRSTACDVLRARYPGWTLLEAAEGERALAILDDTPVDCIVTDLAMPGVDGLHMLLEVMVRHPSVPVVVVSAYSGEEPARFAMPRFLSKPVDVVAIGNVVANVLDPSRPGDTAPLTVEGLVQVIAWERRTCVLDVRPRIRAGYGGALAFVAGKLVHAEAKDERGSPREVVGEEAAVELLVVEAPLAALAPASVAIARDSTLSSIPLRQLFARAKARRSARDEETESGTKRFPTSAVLRIADQLWAIEGARGVAIVDYEAEVKLTIRGEAGLAKRGAAPALCGLIREAVRDGGRGAPIRELTIMADDRIHVLFLAPYRPALLIYVVADAALGSLPVVRIEIERAVHTLQSGRAMT